MRYIQCSWRNSWGIVAFSSTLKYSFSHEIFCLFWRKTFLEMILEALNPFRFLHDLMFSPPTPTWNLHLFLDLGIVKATSNQSLGGIQCVLRVGDRLAFSRHAHQTLSVCCESDNRRSRSGSLCILQHLRGQEKTFSCFMKLQTYRKALLDQSVLTIIQICFQAKVY